MRHELPKCKRQKRPLGVLQLSSGCKLIIDILFKHSIQLYCYYYRQNAYEITNVAKQ